MRRLQAWPIAFLLAGGLTFILAQTRLQGMQRPQIRAEIQVALPVFVQVILAGGDRHLAASWGAIRALVTETIRMKPDEFQILGQVQRDVAWLNPAHEDNYYIAAAILPWEGQLDAAQSVLRRATVARPFDYQPPFYYAFYLVHFLGDSIGANEWLRKAALQLNDPQERLILEDFAARWLDRSQDLETAARIVDAMAAQTKRKDFADYLHKRGQRLRDLASLRRAASIYRERVGRPAETLQDLVVTGLISKVPVDPFGSGFGLDAEGKPIFLSRSTQ